MNMTVTQYLLLGKQVQLASDANSILSAYFEAFMVVKNA